jgi:hypothetical protein
VIKNVGCLRAYGLADIKYHLYKLLFLLSLILSQRWRGRGQRGRPLAFKMVTQFLNLNGRVFS